MNFLGKSFSWCFEFGNPLNVSAPKKLKSISVSSEKVIAGINVPPLNTPHST